jgi:hypothetical protein
MKWIALVLAIFANPVFAQQPLTQNWTDKKHDFGAQDTGTIRLEIQGTNNFYYVYSTLTTSTDQALSGFDNLKQFLPIGGVAAASAPTSCADYESVVLDAIKNFTKPEPDSNTKVFSSVPAVTTSTQWKDKAEDAYVSANSTCTDAEKKDPKFIKIQQARNLIMPADGTSSVTVTINAKPCRDYTVVVTELFGGSPTSAGPLTATFSTTCDRVTFSGGPLFTEIGNPSYVSRPSPTQSGQFLSVENTGKFRATLTGLVNFNILHSDKSLLDPFRLGFSTGPVFQNSQAGTSSFGWLIGGSVSVFKYAYVTAGEHWGSFPDTPFGFKSGDPIPANFGTLTPVVRHTWRFGLAITFRTADLSKVFTGGSGPAPATTAPTAKTPAPVSTPPDSKQKPSS